eukprot:12769161-Alexandrium_andersonii.AAC.1
MPARCRFCSQRLRGGPPTSVSGARHPAHPRVSPSGGPPPTAHRRSRGCPSPQGPGQHPATAPEPSGLHRR